ncbi:MAG: hypothetical protein SFV54_25925 [Bryobacteraceae bacterium]|nr:hypothetical protein [Bryobacteraceae bacterium]
MSEMQMNREEQALRDRLRAAVRRTETPPFLEARIRANLRATPAPARWRSWALAATAALVVLAAGVAYQLGHLRLTSASQDAYIASVTNRVATLMRVGLKDHIHCAVFRKYPGNTPPAEELLRKISPEYRDLAPVIARATPRDFHLVIAHECRYQGRNYVHLALKRGSRLLSLVVARKADGESFATENTLPAQVAAGLPLYSAAVQRFEIAAFESRQHLVYVISDMPAKQNMETMLAAAPGLKEVLAKLEGGAA